jgi:hypothetical protein
MTACLTLGRVAFSLRSVCHCNPGVREVAFGFPTQEMVAPSRTRTGHVTISCSM